MDKVRGEMEEPSSRLGLKHVEKLVHDQLDGGRRRTTMRTRPVWITSLVHKMFVILWIYLFLLLIVDYLVPLPQCASTTGLGEGSNITGLLFSTPG